jgi:hypothetical protein
VASDGSGFIIRRVASDGSVFVIRRVASDWEWLYKRRGWLYYRGTIIRVASDASSFIREGGWPLMGVVV